DGSRLRPHVKHRHVTASRVPALSAARCQSPTAPGRDPGGRSKPLWERPWPLPQEAATSCHARPDQSFVTRLISARLVTPCFTFINADWRRSRTPDRCAASAICSALPPSSTIEAISSVIGITWYTPVRPL